MNTQSSLYSSPQWLSGGMCSYSYLKLILLCLFALGGLNAFGQKHEVRDASLTHDILEGLKTRLDPAHAQNHARKEEKEENQNPTSMLCGKTWIWDTSVNGGGWGNAGYTPDTGDNFVATGSGTWWACPPEDLTGQMNHSADKLAGDCSSLATMTFNENGTVRCFDADGNEFRSGTFSIENWNGGERTETNGVAWAKGTLKTSEGATLWPFEINAGGKYVTEYEILELNYDKLVLVYPDGGSQGAWGEASWWRFKAVGTVGETFTYTYDDNTLTYQITDAENKCVQVGDGREAAIDASVTGTVSIPKNVTYFGQVYEVTSIGSNAFKYRRGLTTITIPNSVTTIGEDAFWGCSGLTTITIPNSVTSIGSEAFSSTAWYDNQPDGLVYAGNVAYKYKGTMPDNTTITLKDGTVGIAGEAFKYRRGLTTITIPNSVTTIGEDAFWGCSGLTTITIPNSVTTIGQDAFCGCIGLTAITIPSSVTSIGYGAFYGCSALTTITIPNSVTSIGNSTFEGCSALTTITIPNSVTTIGVDAFWGCIGLTAITIPSSVTSIGYGAFDYCSTLTSITVESGNTVYDSRNNCNAIIETASNILIKGCQNTVIPNSVTSIGKFAFYGCGGLTSVTIPNSVTSIGEFAFYGCSALTSVTIPNSVTSIGNSAFYGCSALTTITIPNSVTSIRGCAFEYCSGLTSVTIPNSVTSIGNSAFLYCSGLTSVTIPNSVTSIGNSAFYGCSALTTITIPNSVTSIGEFAFEDCGGFIFCNRMTPPDANSNSFSSDMTAVVPQWLYGTYKNADGWKKLTIEYPHLEGLVDRTNTTLTLRGTCVGDAAIAKHGFCLYDGEGGYIDYEGQDGVRKVEGLVSGKSYDFAYYVATADGSQFFSDSQSFQTLPVSLDVTTTPGITTCELEGAVSVIDAKVTGYGFYLNGSDKDYSGAKTSFHGLDPSTTYKATFYAETEGGGREEKTVSFTTGELLFSTEVAKVVSVGNVNVAAKSNIDDENANVGFEWRRSDWTESMPSNRGRAYMFEGMMDGSIHNLYTDGRIWWKYRPYYLSDFGNYHYGEWMEFDPTNTSYFEPTVHTYAIINQEGNTAVLKGYMLEGTEEVTMQGFKYWKKSDGDTNLDDAAFIESQGQMMSGQLTGLEYETDYCFVAFVTTSDGQTFYGEQQTFTTGLSPMGIEGVEIDSSTTEPVTVVTRYNMNGQRIVAPQKGVNILRMSDGRMKKVLVK